MKPIRWYTFRRANVGSFFYLANFGGILFWKIIQNIFSFTNQLLKL